MKTKYLHELKNDQYALVLTPIKSKDDDANQIILPTGTIICLQSYPFDNSKTYYEKTSRHTYINVNGNYYWADKYEVVLV